MELIFGFLLFFHNSEFLFIEPENFPKTDLNLCLAKESQQEGPQERQSCIQTKATKLKTYNKKLILF